MSGANSAATNGCGSYFAASALRSTAARRKLRRHRTDGQYRLRAGTFSSRPSARSTNIGLGSMISDVTPASFNT